MKAVSNYPLPATLVFMAAKYLLLIRGDESAAEHADDGCGGWDTEYGTIEVRQLL
jgi:hypothetical protein